MINITIKCRCIYIGIACRESCKSYIGAGVWDMSNVATRYTLITTTTYVYMFFHGKLAFSPYPSF